MNFQLPQKPKDDYLERKQAADLLNEKIKTLKMRMAARKDIDNFFEQKKNFFVQKSGVKQSESKLHEEMEQKLSLKPEENPAHPWRSASSRHNHRSQNYNRPAFSSRDVISWR